MSFLKDKYDLSCTLLGYPEVSNIKIKPLNNLERSILVDLLNEYVFKYLHIDDCMAVATGKTTVDIVSIYNNKLAVLDFIRGDKCLYLGDEVTSGNDREIAEACYNSICISDISETRLILELLGEQL